MLNNYGSCRYDAAAQLCALVYEKETGDDKFADWAEGQMEYIMGKNPMNRAYIVGLFQERCFASAPSGCTWF